MNLNWLKEPYWKLLRKLHPTQKTLTPGDWMDAIAAHVGQRRGVEPFIFVDVGAHDGGMAKRFLERFPDMHVHAFEPQAGVFTRLRDRLAHVPGSRHNVAVGEKAGTLKLICNATAMTTSPLPANDWSRRYFDAATQPVEERSVPVITLDDWFTQSGLSRIDILKLDIQGYEDRALRGAGKLLDAGATCVFLEVNFVPFYEGSALFADVDAILRSHGYRLHNLYNLATHLPEGQLGSGDALYVRDVKRKGERDVKQAAPPLTLRKAA